MSNNYQIHAEELLGFAERFTGFGQVSEDSVNEVVHEQGGPVIYEEIDKLMPVSGRRFKRHPTGAKGTQWQVYDKNTNLTIVVSHKPNRRYLYFPDDGSGTVNHFGNQQFFGRGNAAAAPKIGDTILDRIEKDFKEM